ncbi:MAG: VOC family protein [Spirochaetaceae bacterium]
MKNSVQWFEIPTIDLDRAKSFYSKVFDLEFQFIEMSTSQMYMFGNPEEPGSCGALISSKNTKPSTNGVVIYFTCKDINEKLDLIKQNSGTIITPKTDIGEFGAFAHVNDSEGNRIGLHSEN